MSREFKQQTQLECAEKLDEVLSELPAFCKQFFNGKRALSKMTALLYAHNLRCFFLFLFHTNSAYKDKIKTSIIGDYEKITANSLMLEDIAPLTSEDIEEFATYLEKKQGNSKESVEHYLSAVSSMFKYFVKKRRLSYNPVDGVERHRRPVTEVVALSADEKNNFLDAVEFGTGLTKKQLQFHKRNKERDYAIYKLFLSTGMRISELAGIDIEDIDFNNRSVSIIRKGGSAQRVYFSDSCHEALKAYISVRNDIFHPLDEERALFLSPQGKRLSVRAIQMLTRKYVDTSLPGKSEITTHKLRSTYATEMLIKTGDIKRVSEVLGHKNVTTTERYAEYLEVDHEKLRNLTDEN